MTSTPRLARALTIQQVWWEGNDWWDGHGFYLDVDTAKIHTAFAYEGDEYGHPDDEECDEPEPCARPDFTWEYGHGQWMLLDHGKDTLVRVSETTVYRPATPREIEQQDALAAAEKAERATRRDESLRDALARITATAEASTPV